MLSRNRRFLLLILGLAGVLVFTGCARFVRRGTAPSPLALSPSPEATSDYGSEELFDDVDEGTSSEGGENALIVNLVDQNQGHPPAGIPVDVTGPKDMIVHSDANGRARIVGPPGVYEFSVVLECTDDTWIYFAGRGRGSIVAGRITEGEVGIGWLHRIAPAGPVFSSYSPDWPVEDPPEEVEVTYWVIDRCKDNTRIPNRSYPTWDLRLGSNISILETPSLQSDDGGFGHLKVACGREGPVELIMFDKQNAKDKFDVAGGHHPPPVCKKLKF